MYVATHAEERTPRRLFGGTEEQLRWENLVTEQIGDADGPRFDRATGTGYVAAHRGLYGDALRKGSPVHLCVVETAGAIGATLERIVRLLGQQARAAGATDNTRYGTSRLSTQSFVAHHLGQISTAVQVADAETIANRAAHIAFTRSLGMR